MKLDTFKETVAAIPAEVLAHFGMPNLVADVGKRTKMPPKTQPHALFERLLAATAEVLTENSEENTAIGEETPTAVDEVADE